MIERDDVGFTCFNCGELHINCICEIYTEDDNDDDSLEDKNDINIAFAYNGE